MNNLKIARINKGLTQEELGKKVNVQKSAISKYERGEIQPSQEILIKLAQVLDKSVDYLLGLPEKVEPDIVAFHKNTPGDFTDDEKEEIDNFIEYIISKRDKE